MKQGRKKINWHIGIPIVLWIGVVILGIIKVTRETITNLDADNVIFPTADYLFTLVNTFNSNTFSTFISIIVCMIYQYVSTEKAAKKEDVSGLSMGNMPATIIITCIYGLSAAFDAAISHWAMAIIFLIINIAYVICFFKVFLAKKE